MTNAQAGNRHAGRDRVLRGRGDGHPAGVEGQMGVFPTTCPLMTQIVPGEIIVRKNGERDVPRGRRRASCEITGDRVSIVTDMAIAAREHRRSQGRGGAPARRGPPAREDLRRGSRGGQRLAGPLAGAAAGAPPPPAVSAARAGFCLAVALAPPPLPAVTLVPFRNDTPGLGSARAGTPTTCVVRRSCHSEALLSGR